MQDAPGRTPSRDLSIFPSLAVQAGTIPFRQHQTAHLRIHNGDHAVSRSRTGLCAGYLLPDKRLASNPAAAAPSRKPTAATANTSTAASSSQPFAGLGKLVNQRAKPRHSEKVGQNGSEVDSGHFGFDLGNWPSPSSATLV